MSKRSAYTINAGDEVYDSAGHNVGSVVAAEPDSIVVERGRFFSTDYSIPISAIASSADGRISLNVTKEDALVHGWEKEPAAPAEMAAEPATRTVASRAGITMTADALRIPVYEEALTVTRTARDLAGTRIEKIVATEEQRLDAPVIEERLKVVRRAVNHSADAASAEVFEEVLIDVPLEFAAVDLAQPGRLTQEIVIRKEVVQRTERVTGTVLREEAHVIDPTEATLHENQEHDAG